MTEVVVELCRFRPPTRGAMVIWELTRYCNLACVHCCTDSDPSVSRADDLSTDRVLETIDAMLDAGVTEFFFSGGEPFARSDLAEIIHAVDARRAVCYVNTNGYFLSETAVSSLLGSALESVTVSLDGANRDVHALIRGKPTSFDRAVAGIGRLVDAGIRVRVSHVLAAPNIHGLEAFVHRMVDLGVSELVVSTMFPAGRALQHRAMLLGPEELLALPARLEALHRYCTEAGVDLDYSVGGDDYSAGAPTGCPAGSGIYYVAADGRVSGCSWLFKLDPARWGAGTLHDRDFADLVPALRTQGATFADRETCPLPDLEHAARTS